MRRAVAVAFGAPDAVSLALHHQATWAGVPAAAPVPVGIDLRRVRRAKPLVPAHYVDVEAASAPALRAALEQVLRSRAVDTPVPTVKRRRPGSMDLTDEEMEAVTLMLALLLDD